MKEKIRIASGQGFWGDLIEAPFHQVTKGDIDYLVMDYLAEVTMSILQKQKSRNPNLGYAVDLVGVIKRVLPIAKSKGIKIISNGGGVNPAACADAVLNEAKNLNIQNLKVAVVVGDDIMNRIDDLIKNRVQLKNLETGEPIKKVKEKLLSANVYFGAFPIVEALKLGADIVITGRTTDTGLTLAPMIYEFEWGKKDYDLLAAGTVAGHILECGAQASGGNFLGDWKSIKNMAEIGFPIAEAFPDGTIVITKHKNTGGRVSFETVAEQLIYEIGNPKEYITPDCIADFTSIKLREIGKDRVKVFNVKGKPETKFYKVSCSYHDGYSASGSLTYSWPDALSKAQAADKILRKRLKNLNLKFEEIRTEFLGYNACHETLSKPLKEDDINEVVLKISVRGKDKESVNRFTQEIAPLILTGPPSVTGFAGGRPKPKDVIAYWPALIPKKYVQPVVKILEG